jgi:hypothetical protein
VKRPGAKLRKAMMNPLSILPEYNVMRGLRTAVVSNYKVIATTAKEVCYGTFAFISKLKPCQKYCARH